MNIKQGDKTIFSIQSAQFQALELHVIDCLIRLIKSVFTLSVVAKL
jgi:hypothetical protein